MGFMVADLFKNLNSVLFGTLKLKKKQGDGMTECEGPRGSTMQSVDYYALRSKVSTALRSSYSDRHTHHHHGHRRMGLQESLYRSNSSLELMQDHGHHQEAKATSPVLRREYGSHGSIDVITSERTSFNNGESIFDILQDYKPTSSEFLRSKLNDSQPSELGVSSPNDEDKVSGSPKLRLKFSKFWSATSTKSISTRVVDESVLSGGSSAAEEERQRRRAFAHYDCQSVTANLSYAAKLRSILLSRRRNTTTGASAASMVGARSSTPDGNDSGDEDPGDGRSNDLIESCPFFRNEIGGEEERVVGLIRGRPRKKNSPPHRPALACGVSILEFSTGETHWKESSCPYHNAIRPIESVDHGALYYRHYFYGQDHQNWFGMDENLGPVAISLKRERVERSVSPTSHSNPTPMFRYRVVIRTSELLTLRGSVLEDAIPNLKPSTSSKTMNTKEVLEYVAPEVQMSCLRLGVGGSQTEEALIKLDEQGLTKHYKVGVMYCKAGQSTEEQMYNNQDAGPAFTEFLDTIGQKVRLKGFDKYKAGLDNKTDSTGLYSVYAQSQDCEIMFHVSTLLPFTPNNRQQLLRKRHIGNDIVTIVFQEPGAQPFTPKVIRSQFQHVFIVVRAINPCSDNTHYCVSVTRSKEVPVFGPPIPEGASFPKSKAFADFLLAKVINAENAAHQSEKFATMATRTRQEYLKDLVANYTSSTLVENTQKFSMLSFSSKKKDRWRPRILPDATQRGAICWQVLLDDSSLSILVECFLAISADSFVLIEEATREIVFVTPCKSILGWSTNTNSLRLYYHQGECVTFHMREGGERDELMEVVVRLRSVTLGSVAQELSLKRNSLGQLGFHVQPDGVITQVENMGLAWQAGLRQGARLVEICKVAVSTLTHDQMVDLLKTSMAVTVSVIPPQPDGNPRRGCTLPTCKYITNYEGDYENVHNGDSKTTKTARQQAVSGSVRKRYERSFSPPRSSNSSGYGTGSSSKSFTGGDRFTNIEGSSSSGHSSDERWYEVLENGVEGEGGVGSVDSPPPPLPARLSAYLQSSSPAKMNGFSMLEPTHHELKVSEKVSTCLMKAERSHEHRRQRDRSQADFQILKGSSEYACVNHNHHPQVADKASLPLECSSNGRGVHCSDGHSTDTSSASDRLFGGPSEDDLSGKSSPVLRRSKQGSTNSVDKSRGESPRQRDTGEARLRAGITPRSQRNSANLHQSTLQQDLMKLINPDFLPEPDPSINTKDSAKAMTFGSSGNLPEVGKSRSRESLTSLGLCQGGGRPHSPPTKDKSPQEIILTLARPATVISNASTASSPAPSENKFTKEDRVSPRVSLSKIIGKPKTLPLPDAQEMDWHSLVDTATRAMLHMDTSEPNQPPDLKGLSKWSDDSPRKDSCSAQTPVCDQEISNHILQLESRLTRETRKRLSLEEEVRNLREENRRLQQESQSAAQQLRRFTEWFFQTIDKQ